MKTNWQVENIKNIFQVSNLDSIFFDGNKLVLNIFLKEKIINIAFEEIFFYRLIGESYALKTLNKHNFNGKDWFFSTKESELIDWFNEQSEFIYEKEIIHYLIITMDFIIEVICNDSFLENNDQFLQPFTVQIHPFD